MKAVIDKILDRIEGAWLGQRLGRKAIERRSTDPVTGLMRRNSMDFVLPRIDRRKKHANPPVLIFFDVDGLRVVNNRYGHEQGDAMLERFAGVLRKKFCRKETDWLFHWGGDEFVAIVFNYPNSVWVFEKCKETRDEFVVLSRAERYPGDVSYGVSFAKTARQEDIETSIREADRKMYEMKRQHHAPPNLVSA